MEIQMVRYGDCSVTTRSGREEPAPGNPVAVIRGQIQQIRRMQARPTAMLQLPLDPLNPEPNLIQENWCRSCLNFLYELAQPLKDLDNNPYQNF